MKVPYKQLITIFKNANGKDGWIVAQEINELEIPVTIKNALIKAVTGDNRDLNEWLFSEGMTEGQTLVWIAPIKAPSPTYVWMLGSQPEVATKVQRWFRDAGESTRLDSLLQQVQVTPPLLFVKPIALSRSILGNDTQDEFAIFQTGYVDSPAEVSDLEQRMVINSELATAKRYAAIQRLKAIWYEPNIPILNTLEINMELFAILHNEGHNQGHFVGKWPFEDKVKKSCILYEAVEEFKACLAAVLLAEHLPLSCDEKVAFALSVFTTRFFGYGYEAYCLNAQRRETAREVTVGLLFFEWLSGIGIISAVDGKISIDTSKMSDALKDAYIKIDADETFGRTAENLRQIAKSWYKIAFPFGNYSTQAKIVYTTLGNLEGGD